MKVLVTAISFSSKISGIQRHAFNLVHCLLSHSEVSTVHLVLAPWQQQMGQSAGLPRDSRLDVQVAQMKPGAISRNLWHYCDLPGLASRLQPDLIHLTYPVPVNAAAFRCGVILTLHDLYPYEIPANFGFPRAIVNRLILRQSLRNVDAIACVSDTTLLSLKRFAPEPVWRRAVRIYNCVQPSTPNEEKSSRLELHGKPFLLCVAQHRRNKNIPLLIRAFAHLLRRGDIHAATNLLIVGISGPETANIHDLIAELCLGRRVLLRDGLSDMELRWCYEHCEALVVPSTTEGFGLPVAEAVLAGCRVICSDIPALREVGGEYCRYFALGRDEEVSLANSIMVSLKQPKPSAVALPHLSAEVLADQYVKLYRQLLETRRAKVAASSNRTQLRDSSALREV